MKISLREFQRQGSMYIKSLDKEEIILTQYNLPIAKVVSVDTKATPPPNSPLIEEDNAWITTCHQEFCKNTAKGEYKLKEYNKETGNEVEIKKYLCSKHYNKAKAEDAIVE